jgi:hypothetical protein
LREVKANILGTLDSARKGLANLLALRRFLGFGLKCPPDRADANTVLIGQFGHCHARSVKLGNLPFLSSIKPIRSTKLLAEPSCPLNTLVSAGTDQVALELSDAAEIVSISLPAGEVVSHHESRSDRKPTEGLSSSCRMLWIAARARQAVQFRHHDGIGRQQRLHELGELGTPIPGLAYFIPKSPIMKRLFRKKNKQFLGQRLFSRTAELFLLDQHRSISPCGFYLLEDGFRITLDLALLDQVQHAPQRGPGFWFEITWRSLILDLHERIARQQPVSNRCQLGRIVLRLIAPSGVIELNWLVANSR